jgi:ferrous iron transport protein B
LARLALEVAAIRQEQSYLGQAGKWLEPVVRPLGWDWRIGCAALASFPAREVIVTTLGILYQVEEPEEGSPELHQALKQATWPDSGRPVFTIPVALSIMVFFALCSQCASTLAVIYQETKSWFYPFLSFAYMTALAYVGAWLTFQVGTWIGL